MPNNFTFPQINPIKFYQQSDVLNTAGYPYAVYKSFDPNQNERGMDNDFFYRNLKSWMDQTSYFQPFQQGDKIVLQWLGVANYLGPTVVNYIVRLIDANGTIVKQQNATQGSEVPSGSGIRIRSVEMLLYDVPEGKYLVQIHKLGLFTDSDYFLISEGIEVKAKHENTMLFRYSNTENAYGIFWETGIEMWVRLHTAFTEIQPGSKYNVYEDQPMNLTLLSGVKYREKQLSFGVDTKPMPEYMFDKIEEILICDTLYIDHQLHTRTEGGKLELNRVDKNPLCTGSITVREKENDTDLVVSNIAPVVMGNVPESEWFFVEKITQTLPAPANYTVNLYFNGGINFVNWLNSSNFNQIVDYVNTYYAIDSLNRIVLITNSSAVNALYPDLTITAPYEGHLIVDVDTKLGFDLVVDYVNTAMTTKYAYFFGDNTPAVIGSAGSHLETHTYATADRKYTAYLFWDKVHNLSLGNSEQIITAIEGKLPNKTVTFNCENNQLRKIKNNIFSVMNGFCTAIQLGGNRLTKYAQDAIILFALDAKDEFGVCGIDLQTQNPVVGPSSDPGLASFRTTLINNGVTITTD